MTKITVIEPGTVEATKLLLGFCYLLDDAMQHGSLNGDAMSYLAERSGHLIEANPDLLEATRQSMKEEQAALDAEPKPNVDEVGHA